MAGNILRKANSFGLVAIGLWSLLALLSVETARIPPFQLLFMTFFLASLVGAIFILVQGKSFVLLLQPPIVWLHGIYGLFLYHLCYFLALRYLPPATALLINALWALLIVLFSALLPLGKLHKNHVIGACMGLFALTLLVGGVNLKAENAVLGVCLSLACAFIWSSYSVLSNLLKEVPTESLCGFCFATSMLALISHGFLEVTMVQFTAREVFCIVVLGIGPAGAAFYFWDIASKKGDISLIGALSYAAPVGGTMILVLFGYEKASLALFASLALILTGSVIATRRSSV